LPTNRALWLERLVPGRRSGGVSREDVLRPSRDLQLVFGYAVSFVRVRRRTDPL